MSKQIVVQFVLPCICLLTTTLAYLFLSQNSFILEGTFSSDTWLAEQTMRQRRVREVCDKYGAEAKRQIWPERFTISQADHLLWCRNAKVGTTTWMLTTFREISNNTEARKNLNKVFGVKKNMDITAVKVADTEVFMQRNPKEDLEDLVVSFAIVRHPFERIVSGFQHASVRGAGAAAWLRHKNFTDYIENYVIRDAEKCPGTQRCMGGFWLPFITSCSFCDVPYTVISKMDTFEEDRERILTAVGVNFTKARKNYGKKQVLSTKELTLQHFSNISKENMDKLRDIYKIDLEMFDFDPNMYDQYHD